MSLCKQVKRSDSLSEITWLYCSLKRRVEEQLSTCWAAQVFGAARLYSSSARHLISPRLQQNNLCYVSKSALLCTHHWCDTCNTGMFLHWRSRAWTSWPHIIRWHMGKYGHLHRPSVSWQMAKVLLPSKPHKKGCHF